MSFNSSFDDRETKASALNFLLVVVLFDSVETIENIGKMAGGNADPIVANIDP